MSITKCPGHMRSLKLNFSATVLTLGLKAKIFENLRLCQAKFWGELRTRATFDRCVTGGGDEQLKGSQPCRSVLINA